MPRFFVRQNQIEGDEITILGEDAHHIARSLRMAVGEELTVCDMQGNEYRGPIVCFDEDREVRMQIVSMQSSVNEPPCRIRLFQALPKGDKMDTVIQKAVECGACEIIPFESERCVVKAKADGEERKTERRRRIATEAAKQCGRSVLPNVCPTVSFSAMLDMASQSDLALFCYEGDGTRPLGTILKEAGERGFSSVSVIVGSEGGFSLREAEAAQKAGLCMTGLGKRILRTETASGFVLACLCCATELNG